MELKQVSQEAQTEKIDLHNELVSRGASTNSLAQLPFNNVVLLERASLSHSQFIFISQKLSTILTQVVHKTR